MLLSPWAHPWDSAVVLEEMRQKVWDLASRQHTSAPDSHKVLPLLGLKTGIELAALASDWPAMGVIRVGGAWTLDAPQFDKWAHGQISVLRRKAETESRASGQPGQVSAILF